MNYVTRTLSPSFDVLSAFSLGTLNSLNLLADFFAQVDSSVFERVRTADAKAANKNVRCGKRRYESLLCSSYFSRHVLFFTDYEGYFVSIRPNDWVLARPGVIVCICSSPWSKNYCSCIHLKPCSLSDLVSSVNSLRTSG